jgi:hypothetical protein
MAREHPRAMRIPSRDRSLAKKARASAVVAFSIAATLATPARAQTGRPIAEAVTVTASRCIVKDALVTRTVELLASDEVDPRVTVTVEEEEARVRLVVRRDDAIVGERTLELPERPCHEVSEAAALALAASFDGRLARPIEDPAPPAPASAPPPTPAPWIRARLHGEQEPPRDDTPGNSPARPDLTVAVDLGVAAAILPEPAFAVVPAAELSLTRAFDLRASALITTVPRVDLEDGSAAAAGQADVGLGAGRLDGCLGGRPADALRLRACGGLLIGAVYAEGKGVTDPRTGAAPWVATSLRGDVRYELADGFGLGLALEGFAVLARAELTASEAANAASRTLAPVGAALLAGPFYRF